MRLLLLIHSVVTCYFMLAPIAVDSRHSPPNGITDNFIRLLQSTTVVISLQVFVDAAYIKCANPPKGVQWNGQNYELTPSKEVPYVNALFSVGLNQPLVVNTAEKFKPGAVMVRVSSDDDCFLTVATVAAGDQFSATRKCSSPASRSPEYPFSQNIFTDKLVVKFNKKLVEYSSDDGNPIRDEWKDFEPFAEDKEGGWTLWNLTFTNPTGIVPLSLYMDGTVTFKCFVPDSTTTFSTTETYNSTISGNNSDSTPSGGRRTTEAQIAGLAIWLFIVVIVTGLIALLLVIAGIVVAVVCICRGKKQNAHTTRANDDDDKSQISKKKAKPVEIKKGPTDAYMDLSTKTARPMRPFKPVDEMRHAWYEKNNKTQSFRKEFPKWEADYRRKHPAHYKPPIWDLTDKPTERERLFASNCREIELWATAHNLDERTQSGPTNRTSRKKVKGSSSKKERNASAKSAKPFKSSKSAKNANGSAKTAFEKLDHH